MANLPVEANYSKIMEEWTHDTAADSDIFNEAHKQLLCNDEYLKQKIESAKKVKIVNSQVVTEEGMAADARQLNKSIIGTFAYDVNTRLEDKTNVLTGSNGIKLPTSFSESWFMVCMGGGSSGAFGEFAFGHETTVYYKSSKTLSIEFVNGIMQITYGDSTVGYAKLFY